MWIAVFSYFVISILSFFVLCNTLASSRPGRKTRITPLTAFILGVIWPIGLLAAWIVFIKES